MSESQTNTSTWNPSELSTTEQDNGTCEYVPDAYPNGCLYPSTSLADFIIRTPVLLCITVFGVIGNCLVILVMWKGKASSVSVLTTYLAHSDNLVLLTNCFWHTCESTHKYTGKAPFLADATRLTLPYIWFLVWFAQTMTTYVTVALCAERYIAVRFPMRVHRICTVRNAYIGVIAVTIFSALYEGPILFELEIQWLCDKCTGTIRPAGYYNEFAYNAIYRNLYLVFYLVLYFGGPFVFLCIMSFLIVRIVRQQSAQRETMGTKDASSRDVTLRILGVVITFLILQSPNFIRSIIQLAGLLPAEYIMIATNMSYMTITTNSAVNFLIYCLIGKRFRGQLWAILRRTKHVKQQKTSAAATQ